MKWAFQLRTAEELPTAPHWGGFLPLHGQGHLGGDREGQRPFLCQMWCALSLLVFLQLCNFSLSHAFVHSTNIYWEPTLGQAPGGPRKTVVAKTETIPWFMWLTLLGLLTNKGPQDSHSIPPNPYETTTSAEWAAFLPCPDVDVALMLNDSHDL